MGTLANNADTDEMQHNAAFYMVCVVCLDLNNPILIDKTQKKL